MTLKVLPSQEILRRARMGRAILVVRGLPYQCWRCGHDDVAAAAVHDKTYVGLPGMGLVMTNEEVALAYARELLQVVGHPQAATVKVRQSRTAGGSYLSNGCIQCDALFGAFFISETLIGVLADDATDSLPVLTEIERPAIEWYVLNGLAATSGCLMRDFEE